MKNNYKIQAIDATSFSDNDWKIYFNDRLEWSKIKDDYSVYESWEKLKETSINRINDGHAIYFLFNNDKKIGDFRFEIQDKDFPDKRFTYFRNGLNEESLDKKLLEIIKKQAAIFDPESKFLAILSNNGLNDFIGKLPNVTIGSWSGTYELLIKNAKLDVVNKWHFTFPIKFPNYTIKFFEDIPDDLMEEYIHVFKELLHDMPPNSEIGEFNLTAEKEKKLQERAKAKNHTSYKYLIFNENNKLIAHTNVRINKNNPKSAAQYMTGVLHRYRRKGLAKWLKSSMLIKIMQDFPTMESIKTNTHPSNRGSIEVSQQMGFVKTGTEKEFLISMAEEIKKETTDIDEN